jgi:TonB family protein
MKNKRNKLEAILGTIFFHVLIMVCFIFFGFSTQKPVPKEECILVNLGYDENGTGNNVIVDPGIKSVPDNFSSKAGGYLTQNTEDEIIFLNKGNKTNKEEFKIDKNALYFGKRSKSTASQGITGKEGIQGSPDGTLNAKNYTAFQTNKESNPSYKIEGRTIKSLVKPDYKQKDEGIVVVEIWVDKQGNVTNAMPGARGTTITNQYLWKLAAEAARQSKFDSKANAPEEQKGTITYHFVNLN